MIQKRLAHPRIHLAVSAALLIAAHAFAGEDCSREISLKKHPFSAPQEWRVGKNFTIPEGKSKLYFADGVVGTELDKKTAAYCTLAAKAPHDNPREFRTHQGELGSDGKPVTPRTIQVAKLEYGLKKETKAVSTRHGSVQNITFERWIPDHTVLAFIAGSDDKTVSKITCSNVKTYDQLKNIFGDYIKGVQCPDIETEEASIQKNQAVDEDVTLKSSTTGDETSDAGGTKKPKQGEPSGQTTN